METDMNMVFLTRSHTAPRCHRQSRLSISRMFAIRHQRRKLAQLDDAALRDMGLTRREVLVEARRLPWDL